MFKRLIIVAIFALSVVGTGVVAEISGFEFVETAAACSSNSAGGGC